MAIERVTFQGVTLAGTDENVVHFKNPDGTTTHAAMAAYLQTNWIAPLLTIQNNNFTWVQMLIQRVDGGGAPASTHVISPGQGTQGGDAAPPFVSALIQLRTSVAGRKGRGRIYLPGLSIGTFSDRGRLTSGSYTAFQTGLLNAWRTKFLFGGTAPITIGVCSRDNPSDFDTAVFMDVRQWCSVQRRRNYFIGM
jgi:hypothetical protein